MFLRLLLPAAVLLLSLANFSMGSQVFQTMERKIGQKFAAVRVDRAKLAVAVGALGRANANNFKNRLVNDQLKGVKRENLEGVANFVCSKLSLTDPAHCTKVMKNALRQGILAASSETKMEEFSFDEDGFKFVYGFIMTVKNSQGDVDIVYTIHQQEFRLSTSEEASEESSEESSVESTHSTPTRSTRPARSTRPSTTTRSTRPARSTRPSITTRSTGPFRPTTSTLYDPGFTVEEMEAIKEHYSKYEALLKLKQENVIESISYV